MKIVADTQIPFLKGLLEPFAEVVYLPGHEIKKEHILDADALIIRSRTRCDRELLEGTTVKFIGTTAIGYDHIDVDYCEVKHITWVNAAGCNSRAVAQWVTSSLLSLAKKYGFALKEKTLGIIGVGQCGQKVERYARLLGMKIILNDPPRSRVEGEKNFDSLDRIIEESDIITLHPTLEKEGPDKTFHLLDSTFFSKLTKKIFLINSSRGKIVDNKALKQAIIEGKIIDCAIDCWENEPDIDSFLLKNCLITTPHIAGYTADGKVNATRVVINQLKKCFNLNMTEETTALPVSETPVLTIPKNCPDKVGYSLIKAYNPLIDSNRLKETPEKFELIRAEYPLRGDYKAFKLKNLSEVDAELLGAFGFQLPHLAIERKLL
jgi:erythronate-4-phosphate dehydrogenase